MLDKDKLLVEVAGVSERVLLLERRRWKGFSDCKEAMELSRRKELRRVSALVALDSLSPLREGILMAEWTRDLCEGECKVA